MRDNTPLSRRLRWATIIEVRPGREPARSTALFCERATQHRRVDGDRRSMPGGGGGRSQRGPVRRSTAMARIRQPCHPCGIPDTCSQDHSGLVRNTRRTSKAPIQRHCGTGWPALFVPVVHDHRRLGTFVFWADGSDAIAMCSTGIVCAISVLAHRPARARSGLATPLSITIATGEGATNMVVLFPFGAGAREHASHRHRGARQDRYDHRGQAAGRRRGGPGR